MSIRVQSADGVIHEFPDGVPQSAIDNAMRQYAQQRQPQAPQPPAQTWQEYLGGIPAMAAQGASFNFMDEIGAGVDQGMRAIGLPNPSGKNTWADAQAHFSAGDRDYEKKNPLTAPLAQAAGGIATGLGALNSGVTFGRFAAPNADLFRRGLASAADGLAFGAASGAGSGDTASSRFGEAAKQGLVGGLFGGGATLLGDIFQGVGSNIAARIDPRGYANRQIAQTVLDSGRSPQQVANSLNNAAAEGQSSYRLMDDLGVEGRNKAYTAASAPGPGRAALDEFLRSRNADAPARLSGFLQDAAGTNQTAEALKEQMENAARRTDTQNFTSARNAGEGQIVSPGQAVTNAQNRIAAVSGPTGPDVAAGFPTPVTRDTPISELRRLVGQVSTDSGSLIDFPAVAEARMNAASSLDEMAKQGDRYGQSLVTPYKEQLDAALSQVSPEWASALATSSRNQDVLRQIAEGSAAAGRARIDDTLSAFANLSPAQQATFRTGYFDTILKDLENKRAGPFTDMSGITQSPARREIIPEIAVRGMGGTIDRQLSREQKMMETMTRALAGSRTDENAANRAAAGIDASVIGNAVTGNLPNALYGLGRNIYNAGTGNTSRVREETARLLMSRGDVVPMMEQAAQSIQKRRALAAALARFAPITAVSAMPQTQQQ